jgi:hypothetical protein
MSEDPLPAGFSRALRIFAIALQARLKPAFEKELRVVAMRTTD